MTRVRSVAVAVLLTVAALAAGHEAWLGRRIVVSADLKFPRTAVCQVFYTETESEGLRFGKWETATVKPGGVRAEFSLPVERLGRLRFDFGTSPGTVRAAPLVVKGAETRVLDWREFGIRHDIGRFDVDARGAVDVEATGGDPYVVCTKPIGVLGRVRVDVPALVFRLLLAALVWWPLAGPRSLLRRTGAGVLPAFPAALFASAAVVLVAIRFRFSSDIPPVFNASSWDDGWVVNASSSILRGNWLGTYNDHTLIKGCVGPSVLALARATGLPFLLSETVLHVAGCAFFLWVVSRFVRNRVFLFAAFAFLLFDPLSFSWDTYQRIYRNGMVLWQLPLACGCLFMMFRRSRESIRRFAPWGLFAGVFLWLFANTREDGIWLVPFVFAAVALSCVRAWSAGTGRHRRAVRAATCLLPVAVLLAGNGLLCAVHWRLYGLPLRNDRDAGNYARVVRDLYLIEPDPADEARLSGPEHDRCYHNISYSTLCRAYDASPTLADARAQIDAALDGWNAAEGHAGRDLVADHVLFALRKGVAAAGRYESLPASEAFYGAVHRELSEAFADGRLVRRGVSFTPMAAPFRPEFAPAVFREWKTALARTADFALSRTALFESGRGMPPGVVALFERASGNSMPLADGIEALGPCVARANRMTAAYSSALPWLLLLALAGYAVEAVLLLRRPARMDGLADGWLFATGFLGSVLVQTACIGYMTATTFFATYCLYLAPSILSAQFFAVLVAGIGWTAAMSGRSEGKRKENK